MKSGVFVITALAASAVAVPHRREHHHQHLHARDPELVVHTVTEHVMETHAAVVYVNQYGDPVSPPGKEPTVEEAPASTSTDVQLAAESYAPSSYESPAPVTTSGPETSKANHETKSSSSAAPASTNESSEDSTNADSSSSFDGYSIAYAPYRADGTCKEQSEISADFAGISEYEMVRIYGTDCDQVPMVVKAARANNLKVFAGIFDIQDASGEAELLIDGAKNDWDIIHTISVGNELINKGEASVDQVIAAMETVRSMVRKGGYDGPVVTVDVWVIFLEEENQALCDATDYVAVNCHAFFDSTCSAEDAGATVSNAVDQVREACGDKEVLVTESGWPSGGSANGNAIPSPENQEVAISSLRESFAKENIVLFSAYNDAWKEDFDGSFGAERFWGIYGDSPAT